MVTTEGMSGEPSTEMTSGTRPLYQAMLLLLDPRSTPTIFESFMA
jgi:hypothetical protein